MIILKSLTFFEKANFFNDRLNFSACSDSISFPNKSLLLYEETIKSN